jgi:hypothetical protein
MSLFTRRLVTLNGIFGGMLIARKFLLPTVALVGT